MATDTFKLAVATLLLAIVLTRSWVTGVKRYPHRMGIHPGLLDWRLHAAREEFRCRGHELVNEGYHKYAGSNFLVQTQDMERLVLAPKFLAEIRILPETKLSHAAALVAKHLGYYSGLDVILESRQHSDVCRLQLTQNLPLFLPIMYEELEYSMGQSLLAADKEVTGIPAYGYVFNMVLSISSRVFVGQSLCRDPAWLKVVSSYLATVVGTAAALRPYPRFARSLLRPFLAPRKVMDNILADAMKVLGPAISERRQDSSTHHDLLQLLIDTQQDREPMTIILQLLVLTSAALHTSTMATVHALFDLCSRPQDITDLRDEVESVRQTSHAGWDLDAIKRLKKLGSFLKESMRMNQPDTCKFPAYCATASLMSCSGFKQSRDFGGPMSRDSTFYDGPLEFKPHRYYRTSKQSAENEFAGIEKVNVAWGSGRLTCPGRWYASAMIKLIVGALLEKYDISFPEGQTSRPANIYQDGGVMPDPQQVIMVRSLKLTTAT